MMFLKPSPQFAQRFLSTQSANPQTSLLAGVRVLELASVLAGPSVGQFLAELGADVIKVENKRTNGDVTRGWRLPAEAASATTTAYFKSCNLGKRSISLDISGKRGQEICRQLAIASDVVLASYKPGDAEKFKLDAQSLRSEKPSLVYGQITGYGLDEARVGYDALIQAEAGFTFMNGEPGQHGRPTKMPVALVDLLAAHQLKEALLLALWRRDRTGEGSHVHVSLMSSAVASLANQATGWLCAGAVPQRMGSDHPSIVPYGTVFHDRDGRPIVLVVGAEGQFKALCEVLECPEVAIDERYSKNALRVANRDQLKSLLAEKIATWDSTELLRLLHARNVPAGVIADMPTVFATPQAEALVVRESENAASDSADSKPLGLRQVAWAGDGVTDSDPRRCPEYAEHTAEVLEEVLALSNSDVQELVDEGVVVVPSRE